MAYSIRLPDGTIVENIPDEVNPADAKAKILKSRPDLGSTERTWGEAASDVGAGLVSGVGSLVQLPGQLYGLATGDFRDTGVLGAGKELQEYGESLKSEGLKAREAQRAAKVREAEKEGQLSAFGTMLKETATDPALFTSFLAEQAPQLIPMILGGAGAGSLAARGVAREGAARGASEAAIKKLAAQKAARIGTETALQTGAVMQGADVGAGTYDAIYKHLTEEQGMSPEAAGAETINLARAAGASGYLLSLLGNKYLPGGKAMEEILAGKATGKGMIRSGVGTALKEIPGENIEEVGGQVTQNLAMQQVKPEQALTEGLGQTAAMATLGAAGMGGATGLVGGRGGAQKKVEAAPEQEQPETEQDQIVEPEAPAPAATFQERMASRRKAAEPTDVEPVPQTLEEMRAAYEAGVVREAELRNQEQTPEIKAQVAEQEKKNRELKRKIDEATQASTAPPAAPAGETVTAGTDTTAAGVSAEVPAQPADELPAAGPTAAPEPAGVVSTEQSAGQPTTGETAQPAAITQQPGETLGTQAPKTQQAETQGQQAPAAAPVTELTQPEARQELLTKRKAQAEALGIDLRDIQQEEIDAQLAETEKRIGQKFDEERKNVVYDEEAQNFLEEAEKGNLSPQFGWEGEKLGAFADMLDNNGVDSESILGKDIDAVPEAERAAKLQAAADALNAKREQLRSWDRLTEDQKRVYLDNLATDERGQITPLARQRAAEALTRYTNSKQRTPSGEVKADRSEGLYETQRLAYQKRHGVTLPKYSELSEQQRKDFHESLKYRKRNNKIIDPTVENIDEAFSKLHRTLSEEKTVAEATAKEERTKQEAASYEKAQIEIETERKQREANKGRPSPTDRIGRGAFIPSKAAEQVKAGNTENVLNYLRTQAKNKLHRAIAQVISNLKLKTKIQYVESLPKGRLAEYDPKTDTVYVTAEGLTDAILLHEFVHAATVKVLDQYEKGNLKGLTDEQIEAAEMLEDLMDKTREALGSRYPDAFENIFEFVSYALTDKFFQEDLAGVPITHYRKGQKLQPLPTILPDIKNAWSGFMNEVLKLLGMTKKMFIGKETNYDKRNALLEVFQAFEMLAAAPTERIERAALPAKKPAGQQQRKKAETPEVTLESLRAKNKLPPTSPVSSLRQQWSGRKAYNYLKRKFQNSRDTIKRIEESAALAGKVIYTGSKINAVYNAIIRSSGIARDLFLTRVEPAAARLRQSIGDYAKAMGVSVEDAATDLHLIAMAMHEPERRAVKYMLNVPLSTDKTTITLSDGSTVNMAPSEFRIEVMNDIFSGQLSKKEVEALRKDLDAVVQKYADPTGFSGIKVGESAGYTSTDINSVDYNVVGGYTSEQLQKEVLDKLYTGKAKTYADQALKAMQDLHEATRELDKESHYWSKPVQSVVDFYGWGNYIPLKGKQHFTQKGDYLGVNDDLLDYDGPRLGKELQETQYSFEGRQTDSDNSLIQTMVDATKAAMRAGRKDVTLAVKNAVKDKLLHGEVVATAVPFADRDSLYDEYRGPNFVYHYNADGTVDVIKLTDQLQREAIKRTYQESQPLIDALNWVTSKVGQMHTRYNVAFAPMNFVRDALTNAFMLGADMGPKAAAQYIGTVAASVVNGGLLKAWKVARLYEHGQFNEIERMAKKDPLIKSMYEYIQQGGKVSYLQGISSKSQQMELQRDLSSGNVKKAGVAINKVMDIWVDMFELASRSAAYNISRSQFMAEGLSEKEASIKATGYAKNLANFEQVGEWGRAAGAMFMFFRPAATGAVRAIEAVEPWFRSVESAMADLPQSVLKDKEALAKFKADYAKKKQSAQVMSLGLMGLGAMIYYMSYMLSDDDDQGRNRVATDDPARWSRYARFFIPGMENPIQIPWGFGLGAFAAAGAQAASVGFGQTSIKDALTNIVLVGADSFLPLPVSRINPMEQPAAWLMDTALPSTMRPLLEWTMNVDGLGRQIYNNRQSRYGDAYTGGDNIPEMYKAAARMLYNATNGAVDWSPNTLYFFANNYLDGAMRLAGGISNIGMVAAGQKEFNTKTDTILFDSFFGAPSNVDARDFSRAELKIADINKRLKTLEANNPEKYAKYIEDNPMYPYVVETYNQQVNGTLRQLRQEANIYRRMPGLSPKDRNEMVKNIVSMQNIVKRDILNMLEAYDLDY